MVLGKVWSRQLSSTVEQKAGGGDRFSAFPTEKPR